MSTAPSNPNPPTLAYASSPAPRRFGGSLFGWVLWIGLAIVIFLLLNSKGRSGSRREIPLSELRARLMNGEVAEIVIEDDLVVGRFNLPTLISGTNVLEFRTDLPGGMGQNWSFVNWVLEHANGAEVRTDSSKNLLMNLLLPLVPWLLIFGFIWFFVFRQLRRAGCQPVAQTPLPVYVVNTPN